ncbi:3'-5' exonuclease [Sphingomonas sp. CD22]|uniref:3'-5' exonuclease n=1 Tax=Sphingomonas sp. CD22 TaxID=3100214 RepID=UPI002AE02A7D|nr:3'-5' exonuclease [Sphingomonas sp. CD22]MEA1083695.1 3'-5' exonuclease [Sphingomonas sp. CD22]
MTWVAVPVQPDVLARVLDRHDDYRVLRRIRTMDRSPPHGGRVEGMIGLALDLETTGLDHREHEIIELAMQRFRLDQHGRIIETGRPRTWFEQPSIPIPAHITEITGLADPDVAGRSIADGEAGAMMLSADFVVAHNARFDRAFAEKRLPMAAGRPWACSLNDVDWTGMGFENRTLSGLLGRMGWFFDAHRAQTDVTALLHLLDHPLDDGGTVAGRMVERARRSDWIVDAVDAPFSAKGVLKERGYRWIAERKLWSAAVADEAIADEIAWASLMLYGGRREPRTRRITWTERYSASD